MIRPMFGQFATLRWRLTLFYCALLAGLLAAVGIFVYTRLDAALMETARSRLQDQAALLALALPGVGYSFDTSKQDAGTVTTGTIKEGIMGIASADTLK